MTSQVINNKRVVTYDIPSSVADTLYNDVSKYFVDAKFSILQSKNDSITGYKEIKFECTNDPLYYDIIEYYIKGFVQCHRLMNGAVQR